MLLPSSYFLLLFLWGNQWSPQFVILLKALAFYFFVFGELKVHCDLLSVDFLCILVWNSLRYYLFKCGRPLFFLLYRTGITCMCNFFTASSLFLHFSFPILNVATLGISSSLSFTSLILSLAASN